MKRRRRLYFTSEQKSEIWDRWQRGDSMSSIGRRFDWDSRARRHVEGGHAVLNTEHNYLAQISFSFVRLFGGTGGRQFGLNGKSEVRITS
jgi:hypothetical protein